jgi:hypothetical protein
LGTVGSITDYITANGKVTPHTEDTRVYRGRDTMTDRLLLLANLIIPARMEKETNKKEIFKVHLLKEDRVKLLYQSRLNQLLDQVPLNNNISLQ